MELTPYSMYNDSKYLLFTRSEWGLAWEEADVCKQAPPPQIPK